LSDEALVHAMVNGMRVLGITSITSAVRLIATELFLELELPETAGITSAIATLANLEDSQVTTEL
jgi:hypothetical protein